MKWIVNQDQCMGCGNCLSVCPKQLLTLSDPSELNQRGVRYVKMKDETACIGCGQCELMCTAKAIHVAGEPNGYELINPDAIPPHAGCYLGSLAKALADVIEKQHLQEKIVIFKKKTADVNLHVDTHDYTDEQFFADGLAYKHQHPEKLVLIICSSSKEGSTGLNRERFLSMDDTSVTLINTLNWFETNEQFQGVTKGGCHMLEEVAEAGKASYVARGGVRTPTQMHRLEQYLSKALQCQIEGKPFALVEIVFPCFYRLANRPQVLMGYEQICQINEWFEQNVNHDYPQGELWEMRIK